MNYVQKTKQPPSYLIVIFTTVCITSLVLTNKIIDWHGILFSACLFTFSLLFTIGDIVAEVYGPTEANKLLTYTFMSCFLFSLITVFVIKIPSASFYNNATAYQQVLGQDLRFTLIALFGILLGSWVNITVISRWKYLVKGKYFCLRSVGATAVGELVNSLVVFPLTFTKLLTFHEILNMMIASYVIKIVYAIVSVYPAFLLVVFLKMKNGMESDNSYSPSDNLIRNPE